MADIRKRQGKKGVTYQVRYPDETAKSGYSFATFKTMKEARAFTENSTEWKANSSNDSMTVAEAVDLWLDICEKEGRGGRDPVTAYTYKIYKYIADIMKSYHWKKNLGELESPDIVEFRSWLLRENSRYLAAKTLRYFNGVLGEMTIRGYIKSNVATGIAVSSESRYKEPVNIPTVNEIHKLLDAADRLANSKNAQIARAWERYRPILYLAVDSGMRPQEYLALGSKNILENGIRVERAIERSGKISVPKTPAARRYIDISPETMDMVKHYLQNKSVPNKFDLVFPTATGRWQTVENWRKLCFKVVALEAGLIEYVEKNGLEVVRPKYSPYALRHFYASMLIDQRLNLKKIQTLMGHKNITTTFDVYGHLIEQIENDTKSPIGMLSRMNQQNSCDNSVARNS